MNNVREVNRINERELDLAVEGGASWHDDYRDSAYIFVGNLDKRLTEGDVITIFSQYGEVLDINLPRIPEGGLQQQRDRDQPPPGSGSGTGGGSRSEDRQQQQQQPAGKPGDRRGFGFLLYEDQKSTILAVDNLNGFNLLGRTIRVDHVKDYKMPGARKREEEGELLEPSRNAAPTILNDRQRSDGSEGEENEDELDLADPMASYIAASKRDKSGSKEDKEERRQRKEERRRRREEKDRRKRKSEEGATREEDGIKRHRSSHDYDDRRSSSHRSERERDERRSYRDTYIEKEEREHRRRPDESRSRVHRDDDHRDNSRREREPDGPPRDYDQRSREHERDRERDYDKRR